MRRVSKIGVVLAVAMLVAGLAAPASAKKGGHPGAPSGTGLEVTVEPSGNMMWANSVGDQILFDITVTNSSGGDLTGVMVEFTKDYTVGESTTTETLTVWTPDILRNDSWATQYPYTVLEADFFGTTLITSSSVTVGTIGAYIGSDSDPTDSEDAVMTAYPVEPCAESNAEGFNFGTEEDYSVCSFTPAVLPAYWTLTTELPNKPREERQPRGDSARWRAGQLVRLRPTRPSPVRRAVPGQGCVEGGQLHLPSG